MTTRFKKTAEQVAEDCYIKHRDCLAEWMIDMGIATGHGDTFDALLDSLKDYINGLVEPD